MAIDAVPPPDFDDIPTRDLIPPGPAELPIATLSNTLAIRSIRREVAGIRAEIALAKSWIVRLVIVVVSGSATVALSVIGAAITIGQSSEQVRQHSLELERLDDRVRELERSRFEAPRGLR